MTFLLLLLAIAALLILTTVHLLRHDARGPQEPPSSHYADPRFRAPSGGA